MTGQAELRLGPVGVVAGGVPCEGTCGGLRPAGSKACPACGYEPRKSLAGQPYPGKDVSRYRWAFDQEFRPGDDAKVTALTAKAVLLCLVHHDLPDGIFPSQARIAAMTGAGERTVRRALEWLESAGWIVRERRTDRKGHRTSDVFTIRQALPATVAGSLPATVAGEERDS